MAIAKRSPFNARFTTTTGRVEEKPARVVGIVGNETTAAVGSAKAMITEIRAARMDSIADIGLSPKHRHAPDPNYLRGEADPRAMPTCVGRGGSRPEACALTPS